MLVVGLRGCESLLALLLALLSSPQGDATPTLLHHAFNCHLLFQISACFSISQ